MDVDERRRSIVVKDRALPTDLVVLPTIGDEVHLRGVAQRVLRAVPDGASLLVAIAEPAAAVPDALRTEEASRRSRSSSGHDRPAARTAEHAACDAPAARRQVPVVLRQVLGRPAVPARSCFRCRRRRGRWRSDR
jgi:hypothetical protein